MYFPRQLLLALAAGMLLVLDLDRFPSPAFFNRFRAALEVSPACGPRLDDLGDAAV